MKKNHSSLTAYRVAISRAAHQILDTPKVLDDPIALRIIGDEGRSIIHAGGRHIDSAFASRLRAFLVARSRLAEEELEQAIKRGVRQYVVLGAGLDTFSYRSPYSSSQLHVFEVDHFNTQAWKRKRLHDTGIQVPDSLNFVPMDFETQALPDQLHMAGFKADEPAFYSWLGVSMYLKPETVMATLKFIAASAAGGGGVVFDYITPISQQSFLYRLRLRLLTLRVAAIGEPWQSYFETPVLKNEIEAIGFKHMTDLSSEDINKKYFNSRTDKLMTSGPAHIMSARA